MTSDGGPRRRVTDHLHVEYWEKAEQYRFESRIIDELKEIRRDLEKLASRVLMIFGGIAVLAFLIPLLVPVIREWLDIPAQVIP